MGLERWVFGTEGSEPLKYSQWTRYLVVHPVFVGGIAGLVGAVAAIAAASSGASFGETSAAGVAGMIVGALVAGWLWLRWEKKRKLQDPA